MNKVTESSQFLASFVLRCCLQYTGEWGHGTRGVAHNKGNEPCDVATIPKAANSRFFYKVKTNSVLPTWRFWGSETPARSPRLAGREFAHANFSVKIKTFFGAIIIFAY